MSKIERIKNVLSKIERIKNVLSKIERIKNALNEIERIKNVLRRYFEADSDGKVSKTYDETFSAADAIEEIREIVGKI